MANPQPDKYTKISNELIENALCRTNLSSYQSRIVWAIFRKTYGWDKTSDWISNSQLVDMTGITKQNVSRTLKELKERNIIVREGYMTSFQKDYDQWVELSRKTTKLSNETTVINPDNTVINPDNTVINPDNEVISIEAHKRTYTKDNITKDNIQKKVFMSDSEEIRLSKLLFDLMRINNPNCKGPNNFQGWAKSVDLMFRIDNRTSDQVEYLVRWSQQDDFWMGNILSMGTLRDKFDRLVIQAKKNPIKENGMKACSEKTLKTMRNLEAFLNEE